MKHQVNLYSFLAYHRGPWAQALCALDFFWGTQSSITWSHSLLICLQHLLPLLDAFMSNCYQTLWIFIYSSSFLYIYNYLILLFLLFNLLFKYILSYSYFFWLSFNLFFYFKCIHIFLFISFISFSNYLINTNYKWKLFIFKIINTKTLIYPPIIV